MNTAEQIVPGPGAGDGIDLSAQGTGVSREQVHVRSTRATKMIATVGPAEQFKDENGKIIRDENGKVTVREDILADMVRNGANLFRLNFSHGTHSDHLAMLSAVRKVSAALNVPVGVIQDLQGPKIRISEMQSERVMLKDNSTVTLKYGKFLPGEENQGVIRTEAFVPEKELEAGDRVFLADARIELIVEEVGKDGVRTRVVNGGALRSKAGIAIPDSEFNLPATSDKDLKDLDWGLANGVDFVALSFVSSAKDVEDLRKEMVKRGRVVPIIAKIERRQALENLEEIIAAADAVMVARGDLGVDIPWDEVPEQEERIIELARKYGKPVIVATQMMLSMVTSELPTRGESVDVYFAGRCGADGVMTSEETAIGDHPSLCVHSMVRQVRRGELKFDYGAHQRLVSSGKDIICDDAEKAVIEACDAARDNKVNAIIVCSESGNTCRLVSKQRPPFDIYGVAPSREALSRMTIYWGITPLPIQLANLSDEERRRAFTLIAKKFFDEHQNQNVEKFAAVVIKGQEKDNPHSPGGYELMEISRAELTPEAVA